MKRRTIFLVFLFFIVHAGIAQVKPARNRWYVPDFAALQYAGSIGFLSAGAGYDIFSNKGSIDFLFGVVPAFTGSSPLETFTFKFTAMPWKINAGRSTQIHPINVGTYFSYTFGKEFSSDLPGWYPEGYYWWSEAVRVNLFIGGDVRFVTHKFKKPKRITAYYEIGTNEIKFVSYVQNRHALTIWDILHAGVGVRYSFRYSE